MRWAKESWNRGMLIDYLVLENDDERYYFLATNDAEITEVDFTEAEKKVKKQFGYRLGWTNASPSWLQDNGYKYLD